MPPNELSVAPKITNDFSVPPTGCRVGQNRVGQGFDHRSFRSGIEEVPEIPKNFSVQLLLPNIVNITNTVKLTLPHFLAVNPSLFLLKSRWIQSHRVVPKTHSVFQYPAYVETLLRFWYPSGTLGRG